MSIRNNFPAIRPSLLLDFAKVQALDPRVTFARASTATFTNSLGLIQTAASGVPRFDFNPTTDECNGLLIEEQRTNLLVRSEEFNNASWPIARASVTANSAVAPDGATTGDKLVEDTTASNTHFLAQSTSYTSGVSYSLSIYAKAAERSQLLLLVGAAAFSDAAPRFCYFNLSTASIFGLFGSGASASITNVGNDWYRCNLTFTASATASTSINVQLANGGTNIYTGDGTSGLYIWGAQLEAGAFPTSYIPTVASQVTRAADAASMTGTNFSSWYNQAEGTIYSEYSLSGTSSKPVFVSRATASAGDRLQHGTSGSVSIVNNTIQADIGSGINITSGKQAFAYKLNDFAGIIRGLPVSTGVGTDTFGTVPVVNYATIGYFDFGGGDRLNGTIKKIAYYPIRCTNAQLQGLTS